MVPELVKQMLAGGVIGEPVWFDTSIRVLLWPEKPD